MIQINWLFTENKFEFMHSIHLHFSGWESSSAKSGFRGGADQILVPFHFLLTMYR